MILWPFPCAISIDNQPRDEYEKKFIAQVEGLMECPERKMSEGESEGKERVEAKEGGGILKKDGKRLACPLPIGSDFKVSETNSICFFTLCQSW